MPAVSGSPTQLSTSAATAADLAGTPDDQFEHGDLAAVLSLNPNGEFRLDRNSAAVANNVTVIATSSGVGRWVLFGATAARIGAAAPAADTVITGAIFQQLLEVTITCKGFPLFIAFDASGSSADGAASYPEFELRVDGVPIGATGCTSPTSASPASASCTKLFTGTVPQDYVVRVYARVGAGSDFVIGRVSNNFSHAHLTVFEIP